VPATPAFASGGLAIGKSIMGEAGPEWAVPTYEPQRSGFLKNAPPSFWNNLFNSSGISVDGEKDIHVHVHVDGSEIGNAVAKQIPRNSNLYQAIQRVQ
jgi:hypothetical protein